MLINTRKASFSFLMALAFLLSFSHLQAQNKVVLPANDNISKEISPQGGTRYQRQFYLITPSEMKAAGWDSGMSVNAIGFRLAVAQNDTTLGAFKVYLQNTTDTQTRLDTAWTSVSVTGTSYTATGLHAGRYQWQVIPVCTSAAFDTANAAFSNKDLGNCPQPTSLSTQNITATSAQFQWTAPAFTVSKYYVMYSRSDVVSWIRDSTTSTSYTASSLLPGQTYQWKVWSKCSNDSSTAVNTSFSTESNIDCATAPSGLTNGSGNDTSKTLSWTAVSGATRYDIQYRRQGYSQWSSSISFSSSITLNHGLVAGTTYEWRIRTACSAGTGAYVYGTPFTTTGTVVCYAPTSLTIDSVSATGVKFKWNGLTAGSYKLRYRIMETISWSNAITPMTLVSTDTLIIPKITGVYMHDFSGGSSFVYTGAGVYVAFEHTRDKGTLRTLNAAFARVEKDVIKSTAAILDTSAKGQSSILDATFFRPETLFGSSTLKDSVEVSAVYALGNYARGYNDSSSISARVVNYSKTARSLPVTLSVKDTANNLKYTNTQTLSVAAGTSAIINFKGWHPTVLATDSLIVSVPAQAYETVTGNNTNYYIQKVNPSFVGYDDISSSISGGGLGAGAGLILAKYHMTGCGAVMGTRIFLSADAKGKTVSAVFVDTAGKILSQSESFTPDSATINNYHHFYFAVPQSLTNVDYYVGLVQTASGSYFPVGIQWETENIRTGAYYKAP
ncbi:MAG: fibronectin type III domain-containing protein, partial [Bacteroidota bacterium]|nr:fibronectin type III domain-containing protein [Bacteroidota bacterium]